MVCVCVVVAGMQIWVEWFLMGGGGGVWRSVDRYMAQGL